VWLISGFISIVTLLILFIVNQDYKDDGLFEIFIIIMICSVMGVFSLFVAWNEIKYTIEVRRM